MLRTISIRTPTYLSLKDNRIVIEPKNNGSSRTIQSVPLTDVWVIVVDNPQVTLTARLISEINNAGIGILFCDAKHMPNGLCLPLGAHSRHAEIVEHQLALQKPLRKQLWKKIVQRKIENQATVLRLCNGNEEICNEIKALALSVRSGDPENVEAVVAAKYFKELLPYGTRWNGPMCGSLNYGYAILRAGIAQCAVSHGWLVSRGLHHHSSENAFNLVDDLIEPFRALVDLMVVSNCILEPLSTQNKQLLTTVSDIAVLIDNKMHSVQTAIDIEVESLRRAIELNDSDQLLLPRVIGLERAHPK